ncbi:MAG TPA: glycosyltransferase family 2 protein [Verrucomicrobiae bacterium]|nr:glycosyltransferase family 2 protein [Verrucomicrobiae bacterium]
MKVTLLLPTLNEVEGMKAVLPRIRREWVDEIFVVDGGSTDGTMEYAKEQGCRVLRQTRKGVPGAYRDALEHIDSDIIITFSPDGNSVPEKIPELIAKMKEGYDMVVVSRYMPGAKSEDDDPVTAFGNWMFTKMINILFGGNSTDSLVIFRAWKADLVKKAIEVPPRAGYELYTTIYCAKHKLKTADIPGDEPKRIGGERKMNPLKNGLAVLGLILSEKFCPHRGKHE